MSIRLGAGENVISDWMSNTEKDSFEKLKRSIFNCAPFCAPFIEKMIWKIEIDLYGNAIGIVKI